MIIAHGPHLTDSPTGNPATGFGQGPNYNNIMYNWDISLIVNISLTGT